jgi:hypothetical protein
MVGDRKMEQANALVASSLRWLFRKYRAGLVLCSLVLLISVPLVSAEVIGSTIVYRIEPQNLTVKEGDVFNVSVLIENMPADPGLAAAEFHLSWDPTVLNALSMIKVMFQNNSIGWDKLNNTEGLLSYVHALRGGSIWGNQTLAIITFEAIAQGATTLHFTFVNACSPACNSLDCKTVDCNLTVEKGSETNPQIPPNNKTTALYTMTIVAGPVINADTLILTPAAATKYVPFSVNIEIAKVTDMEGWQFGLFWNSSVLNCTNAEIYNPDTWSTISIGGEINNNFNSTHGRYFIAVAATDDFHTYSGNITIATLTFNPVGAGTTPLTFDNVEISDSQYFLLELSTTNGSITVYEERPPISSTPPSSSTPSSNSTQEAPTPIDSTPQPITTSDSKPKPTTPVESGGSADMARTVHVPEAATILGLVIFLAAFEVMALRRIKPSRAGPG